MPENSELRRTPLYAGHLTLGANLAAFAGWEMPLWYRAGAVREHLAVIQAAGLFDTSHMDVFFVEGAAGREFLNYAFTRDLSRLRPSRAVYGVFLNASGHVVDDALLYPLGETRFAVVVNAGMAPAVIEHLRVLPGADGLVLREPFSRLVKLDLQGPASPAILRKLLADPEEILSGLPYFAFKGDFDPAASRVRLRDGTPVLLSRSGYTGELGFELFLPGDRLEAAWDNLLRLGEENGLLPCGLAARDSLRAGALLPLSHQDIGPWLYVNHPWHFALPLAGGDSFSFTKDFVGAAALRPEGNPHTLAFVGFDQRRVDPREARVLVDGAECGRILSIVSDMAIGRAGDKILSLASPDRPEGWTPRGLACGLARLERRLEPGTPIVLKDARREIKAEIAANIRPDRTASRRLT